MLELRAVVHHEQQPAARQLSHERIEERAAFLVDPLQVLEHQHERSALALRKQQARLRAQQALLAVARVEQAKAVAVRKGAEQREDRRDVAFELAVERTHFRADLRENLLSVLAAVHVEVRPQQVDHRGPRRGVLIRQRATAEHPARLRADELIYKA